MDRDKFFHFENFGIGTAIARQTNTGLSCWSSPEGLPAELLANGLGFELPTVYMRMRTSPGPDAVQMEAFLENEVGLIKGEDFLRHGNGVRGGTRYIDFIKPDIAQRFERFMAERGIEPGERPKHLEEYYAPAQMALREQERQEGLERLRKATTAMREKTQRAAQREGPLSFLRFITKSPPRSR